MGFGSMFHARAKDKKIAAAKELMSKGSYKAALEILCMTDAQGFNMDSEHRLDEVEDMRRVCREKLTPPKKLTADELVDQGKQYYAEENYKKALSCFEQAAAMGDADAQSHCAIMYSGGQGTEADIHKAIEYAEKSARQGNVIGQFNCSVLYNRIENSDKCFYWLEKAAAQNHSKAVELYNDTLERRKKTASTRSLANWTEVGLNHYIGQNSAEQSYEKALFCFQNASLLGNHRTEFNCSTMYYNGRGTAVDHELALYWFEKAANAGDRDSQFNCGNMYANGEGTEVNNEKALYWYEKAAQQGEKKAMVCAAGMYYRGEGAPKDLAKSLKYTEIVAKDGDVDSQFNCGIMYREGHGTDVDLAKSFYWFEAAAKQGHVRAQFNCGEMYDKGIGVAANREMAQYWYKKAADQGHIKAVVRVDL